MVIARMTSSAHDGHEYVLFSLAPSAATIVRIIWNLRNHWDLSLRRFHELEFRVRPSGFFTGLEFKDFVCMLLTKVKSCRAAAKAFW